MRQMPRRNIVISFALTCFIALTAFGFVVAARRNASVAQPARNKPATAAKQSPNRSLFEAVKESLAREPKPARPQSCPNGTVWMQQAQLTANNAAMDDELGWSVAIDGDTAVVGAPFVDGASLTDSGAAYVYVRSGANWTQQAILTASVASSGDSFGWAVAISGDKIVVGAPFKDSRFPDDGRAYFFSRSGTNWTQTEEIAPSGALVQPGDLFGASVAIQGNTALVGAPFADNGQMALRPQGGEKTNAPAMLTDAGAAYKINFIDDSWTLDTNIVNPQVEAGDHFGSAVAIDNNTYVIGAESDDGVSLNLDAGSAYVFLDDPQTSYVFEAKLTAADPQFVAMFGRSVAIKGDTVLIGAPNQDVSGITAAGAAYIFQRNAGSWSQQARLTAAVGGVSESFGFSVGLATDTAIIGTPFRTPNGMVAIGAAYVFAFNGSSWVEERILSHASPVANDQLGGSVAISGDTVIAGAELRQVGANTLAGAAYVFLRECNTPPSITPETPAPTQQGSPGAIGNIATLNDDFTPPGNLTLAATNIASGLLVTELTNNSGTVSARITATCGAAVGTNNFTLEATDEHGATAMTTIAVTVSANSAPLLGSYANTNTTVGGNVTITPTLPPLDNGLIVSVTATTSGGFSGNLSVEQLFGDVEVTNAGPAGSYLITVTALDNCGRTAVTTFNLNVNGAPTITPASSASITQSSPAALVPIATVNDDNTPAGNLSVTAINVPTGLSVTGISNTNGIVTASLSADCTAFVGANMVVLQVEDGNGLTNNANFIVNVAVNPAPMLGSYSNTNTTVGGSLTITPSALPTDNGSITSLTVASNGGFTGSLSINSSGVISVGNAGPGGVYTLTATATDNCGATSTMAFTFTVNGAPTITAAAPVGRQQGSAASVSPVATISDDLTSLANLTVSAQNVPAGLILNGLTNTNGNVTANIIATCGATLGANTITLQVLDEGGLTATANFTVNVTANTAPTLGSYSAASLAPGGSTTVTPSAAPSDNGTISDVTATASGGFTGTVSANAAGVVTINNAGPAGAYTITITATDNCGATASATFPLNINGTPSITPAAPVARQQGSAGSSAAIATVSDDATPAGDLIVTASNVPAGLTVSGITNTNGNITATIAADCASTVGPNNITLTVTDGQSLNSATNFTVNITANTAPTFGTYAATSLMPGGATTVTPSAAPADNGTVSSVTVAASGGFTGTLSVNAAGVVSVTNAGPSGSYTITATATDNCGATTNSGFNLIVNAAPVVTPAAPLARQAGSTGSVSAVATISDDLTPAANLSVTASNIPAGLTVSGLTNANGAISANVTAACAATVGANTFTLNVSDAGGLNTTANITVNIAANTAPVLGAYSVTSLAPGAATMVTPSAAPTDNGTISSLTVAASGGFTGALSVNAAGVVNITNAGPSGSYTITVTATDNCGATANAGFTLNINGAPAITPAAPVARQQGSAGSVAPIATVSDDATPAGSLFVTATSVPPGLSVSGITNNNGNVTATIAADCAATVGANVVTLTVTDGDSLSSNANFTVNVNANTPPALGVYAPVALATGGATNATPSVAPSDNGTIASFTVAASNGFTGSLFVNAAGVVAISNAGPAGSYTVTVSATDNCGATNTANFALTVNGAPVITPAAPLARQQGSAGAVSVLATVSDDLTPAGSLTVSVANVPAGLTVNGLTNNNGMISASVAAGCAATVGANSFTLSVTDGAALSTNATITVNVSANAAPTLGAYAAMLLSPGGATSVTPSAAPTDNGSVASVTVAASNGFTGAVSVNAAGVVNITNAGPSGAHTITVTATDNCGATASASFVLTVNSPPSITPAAPATRQQGSAGSLATIATVGDDLTPNSNLTISVATTAIGIDLANIVNTNGTVTANITADCSANVGSGTFFLTVEDEAGLSASATYTVNVTANTAPTLGVYNNTSLNSGGNTTVTPSTAPADNGVVANVAVAASNGFTGNLAVNAAGVVTITNAAPAGTHTITLTATDNCGTSSTTSFTLTVNGAPTINAAPAITRQAGSPVSTATLATIADDLTAAGSLTIAASNVPSGLILSNLANTNGTITADIAAACASNGGPNVITLTVTDQSGLSASTNFTVNVTANTAPTVGAYNNTSLNISGGTSLTPSAAPADNGTIASVTIAASAGFTGNLSANSAGVVTIANAAPAGVYNLTVTVTDNCGATGVSSFTLTVNGAPAITPAAAITRQAGSPGSVSPVATVTDDLTATGNLIVAVSNAPAGLSVTNLTNNNGAITANIAAGCAASVGANTITLTVTDEGGLSATASFTVNVTANTAPNLGAYSAASLMPGASLTVTIGAPPTDNGSVASITVAASAGFTGSLSVNAAGLVSITNAGPSGTYTITVTATDNCGASSNAAFTLNINGTPAITAAAPLTRQQGSAGANSTIATASDDITPAGSLSVTATNIPAGLTLSNLVNTNGNITATVAAGCAATVGANQITLTVTDGQSLSSSATLTVNVTANTAPTLGNYAATGLNSGASTSVTPSLAPADNGTISLAVAANNGFTGALTVNTAGVVSINSAGPSGTYTVTVTATDNCGANSSVSFVLTVNNAPTVNVAAPFTRQQGSAGFTATLATVSDDATPAGSLTVAATAVPNGLTLNGLANNNGTISATVTAACGASIGANTIVLTVTDGGGLSSNANITVNVSANTPPTLGAYTESTVNIGQARAVTPTAAPTDNGSVTGVTASASAGFTGTVNVNAETGVVLINNAGPAGAHTITVTATDNCGVTNTANFALQVAAPTLAHIENYTAYRAANGNTIRWQSSYEVDNLGFNVYREEGKGRVKLTPALIAGSALSVGPNALTAGDSYAWRDAEGRPDSVYWVEDIDLKGRREVHGPITVKDKGERIKDEAEAAASSRLISELSANSAGDLPTNNGAVKGWPAAHPLVSSISNLVSGSDAWQRQLQLAAGPAVKIAVRAAGWYRVTGAQLQAAGFDPNTAAARLQLYADGSEQAIRARAANGTDNGPLGLDGAIEFYGIAQDTRESDTRTYWLIAGDAPGLRIGPPVRVAPRGGDTLLSTQSSALSTSFPYTVERRERLAYFPALHNGDAENFFGAMVNDAAPVAQALMVNNLDATANQPAAVSVALQGLTQTPHRVRVTLNGADLGVVSFSGQELKTARFHVSQSALAEGANTVTYQALDGATDVSTIAYTRLTYARRYRAENDRLSFTGNGALRLRVEGFSNANVRVFDVTDPQRVFELAAQTTPEAAGYTVTCNGGAAGRSLIAVANAQTPANIAANAPSNWTSADKRADLLILAHRDFMSAAEPLANLRRSQGLETVIVDVADIYDEWNAGANDTEALRGFLRWAQQNWQRAPRYLLLLGDASYDPRSYLGGSRTDFVPTRFVDTNAAETASDESLTDFDGDGLGEYAVGRLPARTPAQAQTMVGKIINYTPGQAQGALFVADQAEGYDFANVNQQLRAELPAAISASFINRGSQPDAGVRAELLNALNAGPAIVTYAGHGAPEAWAGLILNSANANGLTNGTRLPFVVTLTCLNGAFQHPQQETLAESLLRAPQGGAIAVWASSGMTMPNEQMPMAREMYRRLYSSDAPLLGDALRAAKASVEFVELRSTWILFGDPTLRLR